MLEIDHIIPQHLCKKPNELWDLLELLGVPDLEINSYFNWLPVHGRPCNRQKEGQVLPVPTLLNYLSIARRRADRAAAEERKIRRQAHNRDALTPVVQLIEEGHLSKHEVISFIETAVLDSTSRNKSDPLVLCFGVNVFKALDSGALPQDVPDSPYLYDWLETKLEDVFHSTKAPFKKLEDQRDGKTVSIRYAFWLLDLDRLPGQLPYCWELLEVAPFSEIYPGEDPDGWS